MTAVRRGGIYDWSKRDAEELRAARMEELFRWLAADAAAAAAAAAEGL